MESRDAALWAPLGPESREEKKGPLNYPGLRNDGPGSTHIHKAESVHTQTL